MPVKQKKTHHRTPHDRHGHRRSKKFLKVYAPYIPLLLILGLGFVISAHSGFRSPASDVLGYATEMSSTRLLDSANKERVARKQPPLHVNNKLGQAAQQKAEDMAAHDYWSHTTPSGQEPWVFIQQSGYNYSQVAENLAYGFTTSNGVTSGWMNSPLHRKNLLNSELSDVGFGIANVANYQNRGPQTIVVAMYGKPAMAASATTRPTSGVSSSAVQGAEAVGVAKEITLAQTVTKGSMPWINFLTGLLLGSAGMYLLTKHAWNLRRAVQNGERFVLHHPLLDITLVALLALSALLTQTAGVIH